MSQPGITIGRPNFHEGPDVNSKIFRFLEPDTHLEVIGQVPGTEYFEVTLTATGEHGFLHIDLVRPLPADDGQPQPNPVVVNGGVPAARDSFLASNQAFAGVALAPPNPAAGGSTEASIWNTYGGLLAVLSKQIGIDPATAVAVLTCESGGRAFGDDNRLLIRFENHIFKQQYGDAHPAQFAANFTVGQPAWQGNGHTYRSSDGSFRAVHASQNSEWEALNLASSLDDTAAKSSISMGLTQVMGFNSHDIGYNSVQDMFDAFSKDLRRHVLAFFDFVRVKNGITPLQTADFASFARIYNGDGQVELYRGKIQTSVNTCRALGL